MMAVTTVVAQTPPKERKVKDQAEYDLYNNSIKTTDPAKQAIAGRPRRAELDDSADMNLALAEDLWKQGQKVCGPSPNGNDAVERVLSRLSRHENANWLAPG